MSAIESRWCPAGSLRLGRTRTRHRQWKDLAHLEVGDNFRTKPIHPAPMAMEPNTIEGDSRRQKNRSIQRLQSITSGG